MTRPSVFAPSLHAPTPPNDASARVRSSATVAASSEASAAAITVSPIAARGALSSARRPALPVPSARYCRCWPTRSLTRGVAEQRSAVSIPSPFTNYRLPLSPHASPSASALPPSPPPASASPRPFFLHSSRVSSSATSLGPKAAAAFQREGLVGETGFGQGLGLRGVSSGSHLSSNSCLSRGARWGQQNPQQQPLVSRRGSVVVRAVGPEIGSAAVDVIGSLGLDTLTFLVATVIVIPMFKSLKISPILGFLLSGVALNELGLIRNISEVKALSELGILFLLFEMGLELSLERLRALAKFAFGLGLPQVVLTTLAFTAFELPTDHAIGTRMLEFFFGATPDLVSIRSLDEAVVIGAALALSSSAFVLQLLSEKGELPTRFGSATLGILLLQDIAVVPLLVILPILENGDFTDDSLFPLLAMEGAKSLLGLGLLLVLGRIALRRLFEFVAESRSSEAFVAMCLLTVTGTSLITSKLGFSDSLGAFLAGALLAETNYRTQVEADIRPFRGLLLGLFFVTTGSSIDLNLLASEWPNILALLTGLIAIKTAIITALGPRVGLTLAESVRTGLLLSQGEEFAFVVFALANQLGVLPLELNRLLIIVVVLSMALTPLLDSLGRKAAEYIDEHMDEKAAAAAAGSGGGTGSIGTALPEGRGGETSGKSHSPNYGGAEPIVILGFNQMGQVLANFLSTPLAVGSGGDAAGWPFVSFDLNPKRVRLGQTLGFPVLFGDGSRPLVLESAGITRPKAVLIVYSSRQRSVEAVERLHDAFPGVPIYARAVDASHLAELRRAGAADVVLESAETGLRLGSMILQDMGVMRDDVVFVRRLMRDAMDQRALSVSSAVQSTDMLSSRPLLDTLKESLSKRALRPTQPAAAIPMRGGMLLASLPDEDESMPRVAAARDSAMAAAAAAKGLEGATLLPMRSAGANGTVVGQEQGRAVVAADVAVNMSAAESEFLASRLSVGGTAVALATVPGLEAQVDAAVAAAAPQEDPMLVYFSDGEDFIDKKLEGLQGGNFQSDR